MNSRSSFPLRLYGHKAALIDDILAFVPCDTRVFCDLFGGSGVIAHAVKKRIGSRILLNDIMRFAHLRHRVLVINNGVLLNDKDLKILCRRNPTKRDDARRTVGQHYGEENAEFLDNWISNIDLLPDPVKKDIAVFLPIVCTLRHSRFDAFHFNPVGELTGGQHFRDINLRDEVHAYARGVLPSLIIDNGKQNEAYNEDAIDVLNRIEADVLAADPPYVCRGGAYEDCYAFYDDLVRLVSGRASEIVNPYDGKADLPPYVNFARRSSALIGIWDLFDKAQHIPIVIVTYNTTSGIRIMEITNIAQAFGRTVSTKYIPRPRPTTVKGRNTKTEEAIIVCRNPNPQKGGRE